MKNRVAEAEAEEAHLASVLTQERAAFDRRRATMISGDDQVTTLQQALAESRDSIEVARHELMQQVRLNSEATSTLSNLRNLHQSAQQRRDTLEEQSALLNDEIGELQTKMPDLEESWIQVQRALQQVENDADSLIRSREQMVNFENTAARKWRAELYWKIWKIVRKVLELVFGKFCGGPRKQILSRGIGSAAVSLTCWMSIWKMPRYWKWRCRDALSCWL